MATAANTGQVLYIALTLLITSSLANDYVIVQTTAGQLRGQSVTLSDTIGPAAKTRVIQRFLGVAYCQPPTGERRFAAPQPVQPWQGVKDALQFGWVCPQIAAFHPHSTAEFQNEDCLYLNIYAPVLPPASRRLVPVMFYIHGGSFEVGSGRLYDGSVLATLGVVVVTINYRLGAFGFLTSETSELPGNYGLQDQVAALRWVKDNIAQFGGDPDRVTLFGHSAGSASVGLLTIIPQSKNLFRAAISQSGSAMAAYGCHEPGSTNFTQYIFDVGALFQCGGYTVTDVVTCLRTVPAKDFIANRVDFPMFDPIDTEFRPTVDGIFLLDTPRKLFEAAKFHNITFVMGTVDNEFGNYFSGGSRYKSEYDEALDRYVRKVVGTGAFDDLIKHEYTNWTLCLNPNEQPFRRGELLTDIHMITPTVHLATLVARHPTARIYEYHFHMDDSYHSAELNYVFGAPFSGIYADEINPDADNTNKKVFTDADRAFSVRIMQMWTHIAATGQPATAAGNVTWPRFEVDTRRYLQLSPLEGISIKQHLHARSVDFWTCVIPGLQQAGMVQPQASYARSGCTAACNGQQEVASSRRAWLVVVGVSLLTSLHHVY